MKLIVPSPAKVNLALWVKGKRRDGYHDIVTVLHTINLFDYLYFSPSNRFELTIEGNESLPLGNSNLIVKAAKLFKETTGINPTVKVHLKKEIPVGAGLGGGSSNAAATLRGLNKLYGEPLSEEELQQLAGRLGSDVPFFVRGGLAVAWGKGELIRHYNPVSFRILLINPGFSCSTAEVYQKLPDIKRSVTVEDAEKLIISPLISGRFRELEEQMENDLEKSESPCVKKVLEIKEELAKHGIKTLMSGSGSSLFAIAEGREFDLTPLKRRGWWYKFLSAI